jgi:hypothetical protein
MVTVFTHDIGADGLEVVVMTRRGIEGAQFLLLSVSNSLKEKTHSYLVLRDRTTVLTIPCAPILEGV